MKNKVIPAFESQSSFTLRLTPVDIAALVNKIPPSSIDSFFDALIEQRVFMDSDRVKKLSDGLASCASRLIGDGLK